MMLTITIDGIAYISAFRPITGIACVVLLSKCGTLKSSRRPSSREDEAQKKEGRMLQ